jgi:hypothetical protein
MTAMSRTPAKALAVAIAACLSATGAAQAATWATTAIPWLRYPEQKPAGPLPQTIDVPPLAWGYGGRTQMVDLFARQQPVIVRVLLQVKAGSVGVALANADGSGLLSKETALKPSDQDVEVYFRLRPDGPQEFILLRNYDAQGQAGSAVVKRVQYVPEADLTDDELVDVMARFPH